MEEVNFNNFIDLLVEMIEKYGDKVKCSDVCRDNNFCADIDINV